MEAHVLVGIGGLCAVQKRGRITFADLVELTSPRTPTGRLNIIKLLLTGLVVIIVVSWIAAVWALLNNPEYNGSAIDIDFSVFWAAAKLAADVSWLAPFDSQVLNSARGLPADRITYEMLWLYPPGYMALIYPLGALPFFWAWLSFAIISFVVFALALRIPARDVPGGMVFMLCAPVTMFLLMLGQNSLLMVALLLGALEAIRRDRVVLAGLLIALMTLKPQLGLAIPVALAFGGYWRVIMWATIFSAAIIAVTLIFPGPDYWMAFFNALREGAEKVRGDNLEALMVSIYGNSVVNGLPEDLAFKVQILVSVMVAGGLGWIWASHSLTFDLKAAALCFSILLMTPYAIYYELVFPLAGALYLARAGVVSTLLGRVFLLLIWILPISGYLLEPKPGFGITSVFLIVAFGVCLYRGLSIPRGVPAGNRAEI